MYDPESGMTPENFLEDSEYRTGVNLSADVMIAIEALRVAVDSV